MVNEKKVRLMAKAAAFEEGAGKKALAMNKYFRGDYIGIHLIGAWIAYTLAFVLCLGLWAAYRMEYLMSNINKLDWYSLGKGLGLLYLSLLGIYLIVNYAVYLNRYQKTRKELAAYNHILKRLAHGYQAENRGTGRERTAEGANDDEDLTGI